MRKTIAAVLAVSAVMTGCSSKAVPKQSGAVTSAGSDSAATDSSPAKNGETVLTMAVMTEPYDRMMDAINSFNDADNGCRIEMKVYISRFDKDGNPKSFEWEEMEQADFRLTQDLLNTDEIDIVGDFSFGNDAKYELLKRKGGFVDLYGFMEDDPEVNTETLNRHILELNETDGKLYSFPAYYYAVSLLGRAEYVGTKENWSIDEFISRWNDMPYGSTVNGAVNAENVYYDILRANTPAFVDYKNAEVHFDSLDFRKMLKFCNTFPSNNGQKGEYDYDSPRMLSQARITNAGCGIYSELDYNTYKQTSYRLRDGEYTLVGFPTSDGKGAYLSGEGDDCSICRSSSPEKQKYAWEFIRQFYTEDNQVENAVQKYEYFDPETCKTVVNYGEMGGFCINNAARERVKDNILDGKYLSENYEMSVGGKTIETDGMKLEEEDCDFIENYVNSIERWSGAPTDRELFWIIEDEVLSYLGGGQDIDTAINTIQNRASLWISEKS